MPNLRLVLEYDGTNFIGWQTQPNGRSIQEELKKALEIVCREELPYPQASGRTDSGVHARGQVVNIKIPELDISVSRLTHSVSNILKKEVAIIYADIVPDDFHAIKNSVKKQYTYHILNRPAPAVYDSGKVWHLASELDIELMKSEARNFIGTHDFSSFRGSRCAAKTPVRTILSSQIISEPPYIRYQIIGNGFLKQMVRNIVGTLVEIGKGRGLCVKELLEVKDRKAAGPTAQANGLFLDWVEYDDGFSSRLPANENTHHI